MKASNIEFNSFKNRFNCGSNMPFVENLGSRVSACGGTRNDTQSASRALTGASVTRHHSAAPTQNLVSNSFQLGRHSSAVLIGSALFCSELLSNQII
jgi:hypothetical protein